MGSFEYSSGTWLVEATEVWAIESYWMYFWNWKSQIIILQVVSILWGFIKINYCDCKQFVFE